MNDSGEFYTIKGYSLRENSRLTSAMEDYLEMIARMTLDKRQVRVKELAKLLHVKAPSASKMIQHLANEGYIHAEKYGDISLTAKGKLTGEYLLYRHDVLERFFSLINNTHDNLSEVEKIEHFMDERTVNNIDALLKRMSRNGKV